MTDKMEDVEIRDDNNEVVPSERIVWASANIAAEIVVK